MSRLRTGNKACLWVKVYRWMMDRGLERCRLCNTNRNLTFDHIVPRSQGGCNVRENITILCARCNVAKDSKRINLKPLAWPPPGFGLKFVSDVAPGEWTHHGTLLSKSPAQYDAYNCVLNNSDAVQDPRDATFDSNYVMLVRSA